MIVDEDVCRLIAAKEGLPLDFVAKEFYLMELLRQLSALDILKSMIFKGGTALSKIYLKENYRFSEDLDFDFVGNQWQTTSKAITGKIEGFEDLETRRIIGNKVVQTDFIYKTKWGKKDRIRLDVNVKPYTKTAEPIEGHEVISAFTGFNIGPVPAYSINDLLARKMSALRDRTEGKDVFDVAKALHLANKKKLLKALSLVASIDGQTVNKFIEETINKVKNVDYTKLRNLTNPYIPIKNRPSDWKILADTLALELGALTT